jgi:5-deoxy-5-amino-3-dehydroquinate synthase
VSGVRAIGVELGDRRYDVLIGAGARHELPGLLPPGARRAVIVTQPGIEVAVDPGIEYDVVEIGRGEEAKSLATIEKIGRAMAQVGLARSDVVIAVGGGLVCDVAGFAAATWHRGTPLLNVATTLLAQVDAAIGGKCGVNLPEGKNLVGTYWQPRAVICDLDTLESLPPEEWRSGRGEIAKYAFIGVDGVVEMSLADQVAACVALKARVVAADEREGGLRMILNYGHTLAHALEAAGFAIDAAETALQASTDAMYPASRQPSLRHGEAVAVGLVFAARLAAALGRIGPDRVAEHEAVLRAFDLGCDLPFGADPARLVEYMRRDKKAHGDLSFVLDGPSGVEPVRGVDPVVVERVLAEMAGAGVP